MNNLENILVAHLGASKLPINTIPCSSCPSTFAVIDFDTVKDNYCVAFGIPEHAKLKSADCLHLDDSKKIVCFIEMKDFSMFVATNMALYPTFLDFKKALDEWLAKLKQGLRLKIADSIFIITAALGNYGTSTADVIELLDNQRVQVRYIGLMNATASEFITHNLATLGNSISYGLLTGHKPIILRSDKFDDYVAAEL